MMPKQIAQLVAPCMDPERETFVALYLDARGELLGEPHVVAIGTYDRVVTDVRDILSEAGARRACYVEVAHNHPSGNPTPSYEDVEATSRLINLLDSRGLILIDNVVVAGARYSSICTSERGCWVNGLAEVVA